MAKPTNFPNFRPSDESTKDDTRRCMREISTTVARAKRDREREREKGKGRESKGRVAGRIERKGTSRVQEAS